MVTSTKANLSGTPAAPSRREFLSYLLGESVALAAAASCGGVAWFLQQQPKIGVLGGIFDLDPIYIPTSDQPVYFRAASVWMVRTDAGLLALDAHCVYDRLLVRWSSGSYCFQCPRCGSKYQRDGTWIEFDMVPRDLDRYVLEVRTPHETRVTPPDGTPISVLDAKSVRLFTNQKILGESRFNRRYS